MESHVSGQMILDFIKDNQLTKKEFCKQCKISTSTLDRILKGKNFRLIYLFRIGRRMNVPIHKMFRDE